MHPIFRPIARILGHEPDDLRDPSRAFGLTPEQVELLRGLRESRAYPLYMQAIDNAVNLYAETLLSSRDDAVVHETRGIIQGLRKAASLVDESIRHADSINDKRKRANDAGTSDADRRAFSLYGTPAHRK